MSIGNNNKFYTKTMVKAEESESVSQIFILIISARILDDIRIAFDNNHLTTLCFFRFY